ncbi:hypothetical protein O3G_MSEX011045 [Manduca sexta]|uniref:Uncharacterized protein n=1 Tax=Manduca sexta TaxID=7130 RepID=A0A921ZJS7_MANSE|nr:hypothetical protein O3G_MSEX011045 [Manduca sexta]
MTSLITPVPTVRPLTCRQTCAYAFILACDNNDSIGPAQRATPESRPIMDTVAAPPSSPEQSSPTGLKIKPHVEFPIARYTIIMCWRNYFILSDIKMPGTLYYIIADRTVECLLLST